MNSPSKTKGNKGLNNISILNSLMDNGQSQILNIQKEKGFEINQTPSL